MQQHGQHSSDTTPSLPTVGMAVEMQLRYCGNDVYRAVIHVSATSTSCSEPTAQVHMHVQQQCGAPDSI